MEEQYYVSRTDDLDVHALHPQDHKITLILSVHTHICLPHAIYNEFRYFAYDSVFRQERVQRERDVYSTAQFYK